MLLKFLIASAMLAGFVFAVTWNVSFFKDQAAQRQAAARPMAIRSEKVGKDLEKVRKLDAWFREIYHNLPQETNAVLAKLRPESVVFDVGANVGAFTKRVLTICPTCHVHAFEAMPAYAQYIRNRFGQTYKHQLHVAPFGLSDKNGKMELFYDAQNLGWNTIHKDKTTNPGINVDMRTGDTYVRAARVEHIDLIKIDTEGAEHLVLKGLRNTLETLPCRPTLLIEIGWGTGHPQFPLVRHELDLLYKLGYPKIKRMPTGTADVVLHGTC